MTIAHKGIAPRLHPSVFVAEGARIIGDVEIGEDSSVWFNAVIRGDILPIRIGRRTNVQDGCILHTKEGFPLAVGDEVTFGHGVTAHGCTIGDLCLLGIGCVVLDGAVIGTGERDRIRRRGSPGDDRSAALAGDGRSREGREGSRPRIGGEEPGLFGQLRPARARVPREGGVMDRIEEIFRNDRLIQDFGMKLIEAREGYAKVSVTVEDRFLNAHNIGHGVLLFAVADAAFALSVNAVVDAVGVQWSLNVFRAAKPGETVIGESRIIHKGRQSMVCELTVTAGDGRVLAKGQSTALPVSREAFAAGRAKKGA